MSLWNAFVKQGTQKITVRFLVSVYFALATNFHLQRHYIKLSEVVLWHLLIRAEHIKCSCTSLSSTPVEFSRADKNICCCISRWILICIENNKLMAPGSKAAYLSEWQAQHRHPEGTFPLHMLPSHWPERITSKLAGDILGLCSVTHGLSAETMSKGLLLPVTIGTPLHPRTTEPITPKPSLLRQKRHIEINVRQQIGFPTQKVKLPYW